MKKVIAGTLSLVAAGLISGGSAMAAQGSDMASMQNRVTSMEKTLTEMSQQTGRGSASAMWDKYVHFSGGVAADAKLAGSLGNNIVATSTNQATTPGRFSGVNVKRFSINDAFLNMDATVNDWTTARVGVTYSDVSDFYQQNSLRGFGDGASSEDDSNRNLNLDQAYITLANFNKYPIYLRAGRQYYDFGMYQLHPITKPFTQVLSEIDDTGIQVGFVDDSGFHGSVFLVGVPATKYDCVDDACTTMDDRNRNQVNFGASIGYDHSTDNGFDLYGKVAFLNNMVGIDAYQRGSTQMANSDYKDAVAALTANVGVSSGPFDANAGYAGALQSFSGDDVQYKPGQGAQPTAIDVNVGYKFKFMENRDNKLKVGYDHSSQASPFGLPKDRYYMDYVVGLYRNTDLTLEWSHDVDYSTNFLSPEGTDLYESGENYNVVTARIAVVFG